MKSINRIELLGNVGTDVSVSTTQKGTKQAWFRIATTKSYKDENNEKKDITQWHTVVSFGKMAELAENYVKKGNRVLINGELTYRETNYHDQKVIVSEILMNEMILLNYIQK
jgi:single-strand DNA-binding protein